MNYKLNRRRFLKTSVAGMASITILSECTKPMAAWRFFTDMEAKVMTAMAEHIIPGDDDPGATDAGVINFIDKQLTSNLKEFQDLYRKGIEGILEISKIKYGKPFDELEWKDQDQILCDLESGNIKGDIWNEINAQDFFRMIREHTMMGFYGSPRHGGNKDYISYRMLDLDYPLIIGRNK
jgi:gluconate 2-dehydrogenase gamma chain